MPCADAKKITFHAPAKLGAKIEAARRLLEEQTRIPNVTTTAAIVVALERGLENLLED
jgi:predicted component of type VI protein secretion system